MTRLAFAAGLVVVSGCQCGVSFKDPEKLYLKRIETPAAKVEWYFESLITSTTPDVITLEKGGRSDTICRAQNVKDVQLMDTTLLIQFYGTPRLYGRNVVVPQVLDGISIKVDPDHVSLGPRYHETFVNR